MYLFDKFITLLKTQGQYSESLACRLEAMQRHPLLSSAEIKELLLRIGMGRYAGKQLFAKQFVNDLEKQQLTEIVSAGEDAVRQISDCGWIFILPAIADYVGPTHRFDDLWETASTALYRALVTYHHLPTCRFEDYATVWIQQLIEESFQDNSLYVPSLRLLADYQPKVAHKLSLQLQRTPSTEEVALAMRYMAKQHKEEISLARRLNTPLTLTGEHDLRLAMTKTLLVEEYLELSKEFTMQLTVRVEGESLCFDNVVRIEQSLMQEVKDLYRCGVSRHTGQLIAHDSESISGPISGPIDLMLSATPWRCKKCRQEHRLEGCKRWEEVITLHKQPERICLWLDDGRKFFIEDDFWSIARQLSSSL